MKVQKNVNLKPLNTFQLPSNAAYFVSVTKSSDVHKIIDHSQLKNQKKYILGEGSNTLLTKDIQGVVIKSNVLGKKIIKETSSHVILDIGSGENWHQLVQYAVENNWGGIENLALIPGAVGAAPVQNIAAYGQNLSDTFDSLTAFDINTGKSCKFNSKQSQFGYRTSIFKEKYTHQLLITNIRLKLYKHHQLNTSYYSIGKRYDSISKELESSAHKPYSIKDVYKAVVKIRTNKLPDVSTVPSVGSFFKNPVISRTKLQQLTKLIPDLQYYPEERLQYVPLEDQQLKKSRSVKVPVGRLLDELGWCGRKIGNCFIYPKWASIVTHNGKANGREIFEFTNIIKKEVFDSYGISLESEVTII